MHSRRAGLTLVELLVVVAILGLLAISVLPSISSTAEARRTREAARLVSSFIAKAQARAIGRREWSGFMLVTTNSTSSNAVADLFLADVPAVYRGDTLPALLAITGSTATSRTATGAVGQLTSAAAGVVQAGDLVRFNGSGPYYEIDSGSAAVTGTSIRFQLRSYTAGAADDAGYTTANTPWPPSGSLSFEVLRQPVAAGSPVTLPDARVIDLYWSGIGPPSLTVGSVTLSGSTYRPFLLTKSGTEATPGASASVLFDGTGRLRQVVSRSGTSSATFRQTVTGAVFLLLGRADRAGQAFVANKSAADDSLGANWQYPDSIWIAIDPMTGAVRTAECVTSSTSVTDSQAWVRQALLATGR